MFVISFVVLVIKLLVLNFFISSILKLCTLENKVFLKVTTTRVCKCFIYLIESFIWSVYFMWEKFFFSINILLNFITFLLYYIVPLFFLYSLVMELVLTYKFHCQHISIDNFLRFSSYHHMLL